MYLNVKTKEKLTRIRTIQFNTIQINNTVFLMLIPLHPKAWSQSFLRQIHANWQSFPYDGNGHLVLQFLPLYPHLHAKIEAIKHIYNKKCLVDRCFCNIKNLPFVLLSIETYAYISLVFYAIQTQYNTMVHVCCKSDSTIVILKMYIWFFNSYLLKKGSHLPRAYSWWKCFKTLNGYYKVKVK